MSELTVLSEKPSRIAEDEVEILEVRADYNRMRAKELRAIEAKARALATQYETNAGTIDTSIARLRRGQPK